MLRSRLFWKTIIIICKMISVLFIFGHTGLAATAESPSMLAEKTGLVFYEADAGKSKTYDEFVPELVAYVDNEFPEGDLNSEYTLVFTFNKEEKTVDVEIFSSFFAAQLLAIPIDDISSREGKALAVKELGNWLVYTIYSIDNRVMV